MARRQRSRPIVSSHLNFISELQKSFDKADLKLDKLNNKLTGVVDASLLCAKTQSKDWIALLRVLQVK